MPVKTIQTILFYSRPWEVQLHLKMAQQLASQYPAAKIKFATFFSKVAEACQQQSVACEYLPDLLAQADGSYDARLVAQIDHEVWQGFGTGLSALLNGERFLPQKEPQITEFQMKHLRVLSDLVGAATLSISGMYDHFIYCLGGALANSRGGAHIAFVGCGVPGGRVVPLRTAAEAWTITGTDRTGISFDELANEVKHKKSSQRIEYMRELDSDFQNRQLEFSLPFLVRRYFRRRKYALHDYQHGNYLASPPTSLLAKVLEKGVARLPASTAAYYQVDSISEVGRHPGIYLALHMEPESTLLMYSPWFNNQVEFIRLLSVLLPAGIRIYVKENPKMVGVRPADYYQELRRIPGVYIVNHELESSELIENTLLTASIAGTVIAEAFLLKKPTLCFGTPPVKVLASFVIFRHSLAELREFLIQVCHGELPGMPDDATREALLDEWLTKSFPASTVGVFHEDGELHVPYGDGNVRCYLGAISEILASER